ncbi:hypothetical protein FYJ43_02990 [Cutibacterium sp. WCA-380-WT-3A]|uniref:NAD glycohydrolase translocation F5/8 type C domain-containing protein n=1 Tax=Cutibacterium porci TaxID=2605781 RepID=A0A7K0J527_9ACTN|nr:hypothetical protein [Cutibacterium porci]MSS45034.1 hypothetical protein [Cutibacterium porci]
MPDEWFRPDDDGSGPDELCPAEGTEEASDSGNPPPRHADDSLISSTTSGVIRVVTGDTGPSVVVGRTHASVTSTSSRRRHFPVWILIVAAALVVGLVLGTFITQSRDSTGAVRVTPGATVSASSAAADMPYQGRVKAIDGVRAIASCVSDPAVDSDHHVVRYDPEFVVDDKPDTAWRCNGSGEGQQITLTLPRSSRIVGVGMINGYAKVFGDVDLYSQYRRVRTVRWTMPDGTWFNQDFTDDDQDLQKVMIPPRTVKGDITVTIIATTSPGLIGEPTRDSVLISMLQVYEAS